MLTALLHVPSLTALWHVTTHADSTGICPIMLTALLPVASHAYSTCLWSDSMKIYKSFCKSRNNADKVHVVKYYIFEKIINTTMYTHLSLDN